MNVAESTIICCAAGYGQGGLGLHLAELVEAARNRGNLRGYIALAARKEDESIARVINRRWQPILFRWTPLRFDYAGKTHLNGHWFDKAAARNLPPGGGTAVCFGGQALATFRRARELGYTRLELVSATSHVDNVARLHAGAIERWGIEPSWLNSAQRRKTLKEYEMADVIHVASDYTRRSFLDAGIAPDKLVKIPLSAGPRFKPPASRPDDGVFRVVYVGSVTVTKGVPVLLEAFARLDDPRSELTLVGGTATRGMRRYMEQWLARDDRIRLAPGDPLPHLQRASVYVHPSYDDGFGYAPVEAMACGVPVIVSGQTGMKEHVREGVNGSVVETGDVEALVEKMKWWRDRTNHR